MKIIRARLKAYGKKPGEFISVVGRIKALIEKNRDDIFDFTMDIDGRRCIKTFGAPDNIDQDLVGKRAPILDSKYLAVFNKDGSIDIEEGTNESLPRQTNVEQLKRVMKASAKTDIGNRISDMSKEGSNLDYIQNPINTGIESYEDFEKHNKSFIPSWNLKHLMSPFAHDKKKNK